MNGEKGHTDSRLFVVEHQTEVDYHMIQRIMMAESMEYEKQWKQKRNKEEGTLKTNTTRTASKNIIQNLRHYLNSCVMLRKKKI